MMGSPWRCCGEVVRASGFESRPLGDGASTGPRGRWWPIGRAAVSARIGAILAVNNMGMWSEPALRLRELAGLQCDGGLIAIATQPRCPGATAETTAPAAKQIVDGLEAAGLVAIRVETLDLKPPVACVTGTAPRGAEHSPTSDNRTGPG